MIICEMSISFFIYIEKYFFILISKGQDIQTVAHRLGHKDIVQTLNTYSHFMPDKQQEVLKSIDIDLGTN